MPIIDEIRAYKQSPNDLRERYVAYIRDTGIPLEERWETFKEAPSEWKNHYSFIQHFEIEKTVGRISWYDDFYVEKNETVDMVSLIEDAIADELNFEEGTTVWTKETNDMFKEEILSLNIGSFVLDW